VTVAEQPSDGQDTKLPVNDKASLVERIKEQQLKQEQAIFDQEQLQNKFYFRLRATMGIVAIPVIPAEMTICSLIILDPHQDAIVKRIAASTLFSLTLLMCYLWKVFVNRSSVARPRPVTRAEETVPEAENQGSADQTVNHNSQQRRLGKGADGQGTGR
jgi:hypothetical protein